MTTLTTDTAALSTGVRLPYVEHGDPDGIPLLLLHGYSDSWRSFEPVLAHLPAQIRAISVTQRGHGDADRPKAGYCPRDFAADALALLDTLEIERAVIAGHSMGAWIAQRVAIDDPERVLGLVLAGAVGSADANPVVADLVQAAAAFTDPVDPQFVREFQLGTIAHPLPAGQIELFVDESLKLPARVWSDTGAGFPGDELYTDAAAIAAPTLLLWGDRDAITPRDEQDELLRAIAGSRLGVYEGAGHALHWEQPERFAADLTTFATRVAGSHTWSTR